MMSRYQNEKSLIPLLIISGVVAAPMIFVVGMAVGSQIQLASILTADSLSSWVAALATLAIAILTFVLAKETWYLREAQIEQVNELRRESIRPDVSMRLKNNPSAFQFMDVEIINLGKGIARNIKFKFFNSEDIEILKFENPVVDEFLKLHVLSQGIHSLGIGQRVESFLFSFIELPKKLESENIFSPYFRVEITYEDVEGTRYKNELVMDFEEFRGISEVGGGDPLHKIADDIRKLREQFGRLYSSSSRRLSIDTFNSEDRENERKAIEKRIKEMRESKEKP
jgi:hypothetical protein